MSGKKAIRNLFSGKPVDNVALLLPIIPIGAKIMQVPTSALSADPALMVQCALQIKQLLAPQAMVLYDPSALTEALSGMPVPESVSQVGSISVALETMRRLSLTLKRDAAVFAAVPGPVELAREMADRVGESPNLTNREFMASLNKFLIDLAKEYMERQADGLVVVDSQEFFDREDLAGIYSSFCSTVKNMADYYGIPLILHLQGCTDNGNLPRTVRSLSVSGVLLNGGPELLSDILGTVSDKVIGLTLPEDFLLGTSTGWSGFSDQLAAHLKGKRLMISAPWKMSADLSVHHVLGLNDLIKQAG